MKEQITFVIDETWADKLREMATKEDRSLSNMIRVLLENAIKKQVS